MRGPRIRAIRIRLAASGLLLALAACRSPFGASDVPLQGEGTYRVGQGVHAWPLFERDYEGKGWRTDVFWPLASVRTADDGAVKHADVLFPVLLYEKESGRTRWGVRPLIDLLVEEPKPEAEKGAVDLDLFWPIVKWREAEGEREFQIRPIFFTGRDAGAKWTTLFPVFFTGKNGDAHWTTVFPLVWTKDSPTSSYFHLWPIYGVRKEGTHRKDSILFPFFSRGVDPSEDLVEWDVFAPLFHYGRSKVGTSVRALPLLWHEFSADSRDTVVFPLWWDFEDEEGRFWMLFPFFGRQTKGESFERTIVGGPLFITTRDGTERSTDVVAPFAHWMTDERAWRVSVFPFLFTGADENASWFHLWPLFGREREEDVRTISTLYPFFTYAWGPKSWDLAFPAPFVEFHRSEGRSESWVFPLFHVEREAEKREGSILWRLVHWKGEAGESDFRVLWQLVRSTKTAHKTVFVLNPFFRRETNDRGDLHWSTLFGLVGRTREHDQVAWRLFWFVRI